MIYDIRKMFHAGNIFDGEIDHYIGKSGIFADNLDSLIELVCNEDICSINQLKAIDNYNDNIYIFRNNFGRNYKYFYPIEFVEKIDKNIDEKIIEPDIDYNKICHSFNTKESLKWVGCEGYFGNNKYQIEYEIRNKNYTKLKKININSLYINQRDEEFMFFYPREETSFVPFHNIENAYKVMGKIVKRKNSEHRFIINDVFRNDDGKIIIEQLSTDAMFEYYTFLDGSPVGERG